MKKLLLVFLFVSCGTPIIPENDLIKANLKGSVKSVTTLEYDGDVGGKISYDLYNKEGYLVSTGSFLLEKNFSNKDLVESRTLGRNEDITYEGIGKGYFHKNGKPYLNEEGKLVLTGRKAHGLVTLRGDSLSSTEYNYNRRNLIEKIFRPLIGERDLIREKHFFQYDKKDNLIEKKIFTLSPVDKNLKLVKRFTYDYDVYGNKIEMNFFDSNGMLFFNIKYENDEEGNKIKETFYGPRGELTSTYQYYYFNVEEELATDLFPISYDKYKNWNRRLSSKKDVVERIISYY